MCNVQYVPYLQNKLTNKTPYQMDIKYLCDGMRERYEERDICSRYGTQRIRYFITLLESIKSTYISLGFQDVADFS